MRPAVKDRVMIKTIELEAGVFAGKYVSGGVYGMDARGEIFKQHVYVTDDLKFEWRWYVLPRGYEWARVAREFEKLESEGKNASTKG